MRGYCNSAVSVVVVQQANTNQHACFFLTPIKHQNVKESIVDSIQENSISFLTMKTSQGRVSWVRWRAKRKRESEYICATLFVAPPPRCGWWMDGWQFGKFSRQSLFLFTPPTNSNPSQILFKHFEWYLWKLCENRTLERESECVLCVSEWVREEREKKCERNTILLTSTNQHTVCQLTTNTLIIDHADGLSFVLLKKCQQPLSRSSAVYSSRASYLHSFASISCISVASLANNRAIGLFHGCARLSSFFFCCCFVLFVCLFNVALQTTTCWSPPAYQLPLSMNEKYRSE